MLDVRFYTKLMNQWQGEVTELRDGGFGDLDFHSLKQIYFYHYTFRHMAHCAQEDITQHADTVTWGDHTSLCIVFDVVSYYTTNPARN